MAAPTATGASWSAVARKGGTAHSACLGEVVLTLFTFSESNFAHSFLFLSADWIFCWNSSAQNAGLDLDWI